MTKKYSFALLLMIPALFFGSIADSNGDNSKPESVTIEESYGNNLGYEATISSPNTLEEDQFAPKVLRSFKITDADTSGGCFPTPGQGVIFQKNQCGESSHHIWSAGKDLVFSEYDNDTATIIGTVIDQNGIVGDVNIMLSDKKGQGTTWNKQCYLDGISNPRYFYNSFLGTITAEGVSSTVAIKDQAQHYILADGAGFESGQFGFGGWTGGTFGECTEWFGTLTPIDICDITVDAGDDVEECTDENVKLTASFTGTSQCVTGCVYPVNDDNKCSGSSEEVWLKNPGSNKFYASEQNFQTFDNGTARYTATVSNGEDNIKVDMLYSGYTTVAPANSPKEHSCGANQETSGFVYYTELNGTIISEDHGTFTATSNGPAFQMGVGADVERSGFGASGWFNLSGGDGYYERGDVNLGLEDCIEQVNSEVSYVWSTTDGTIVGDANQQTIEVSESGTYTVTVTNCAGCTATDSVDVEILEKLIIGDFVFEDINRNGLQDDNEPGIDGIVVTLFDVNGNVVAETVTANGGEYSFEVCPGEYYVIFGEIPNGFEITTPNAGDDALDSDADADGRTPNFVLDDTDNTTIDCGIVALCNIDPEVSGDKEVCSGEEAMLTATGGDTYLWSTGETTASIKVSPEATTTYTVVVSDSTIQDCSEELSIVVNTTDKLIIGDIVFEDVNRNGLQDVDEPGVDGVSVTLFNADGTVAGNTVTANGGEYTFEVCPGEYYVVFGDLPADFAFTTPNAGDDAFDSDANEDGVTPNFVITDTDNTTIDSGIVALCTIEPMVDGDAEICSEESSILTAIGGDTYLWSTGETTASIEVSPQATTTYTVVVSNSAIQDCSKELSFTVTVQSVNIDAGSDLAIQFGENATLTVSGVDATDTILWSTGETTASIVVAPESTTSYSVTVVNALGCMGEDSITVNVNDACGIEPSFKILPRDEQGVYTPGNETAACIGDNFYLWMYADVNNLGNSTAEEYTDWVFTYEFPNGTVIVQDDKFSNHRVFNLDLTEEDFGEYKISWTSPTGCSGATVFTLNFPDAGCGENGTRVSDFYTVESIYPIPTVSRSMITVEISTKNQSSLSKSASSDKTPELVSRKETVSLSLYNMSGRLMASAQSYDVEQGKAKVYYQLGDLPSGNYIIKVDAANWTESKQIIVE